MEMLHQQVDLSQAGNPDLIWDLDSLARRELAERFIRLFENRLCVWSESVEQLYTNYSLHFPAELGRKMVVLPNPYAFHDTLHGIAAQAIRKTGLCVLPGQLLGKSGLLLSNQLPGNRLAPRSMPFKPALAQIINSQRKVGDEFLPLLVKGDLREFDQQLPYLHLHRLQLAKLPLLSNFEREDIRQSITRKLLLLYRQADSLCLQPANPR
ncbi:hypothetical protein [Pseudomonas fluvialis]|jgi:hypothetical protein|uniref:Uncharacterized protein n=1 Tax=Pseudomonas fluvialis TaxID=1793966 RepID=A0ABQ2AID1_9PSED|nr:hypothetical protein [Pseudomonas fluvialis]OXM39862.1 hypothetical protein CFY91_12075 [Pseudomonas fluvialis]GGH91666.1 hypothetical protein GCM10007363_12100 [Pseudomonas fluvialis]